MNFWSFFGVLTLFGVTATETTVAPTVEDQQLTLQLYDYMLHVDQPIKGSAGYERLRHVINKTSDILDFFAFLGRLSLNGTLGCSKKGSFDYCTSYVNTNHSMFNSKLGAFFARAKEDSRDIHNFAVDVLPRWGPDIDASDGVNFSMLRIGLKLIFKDTLDSYDYLRTKFASALLRTSSIQADPLQHCDEFLAVYGDVNVNDTVNFDNDAYGTVLTARTRLSDTERAVYALELCQSDGTELQCASESFAEKHGMNGGQTNRCFAKFVIRHNNYSAEANERFVDYAATYLYQDLVLHGLCIPANIGPFENGTAKQTLRKKWVKRRVGIIGAGIVEARKILDETPPTAPPPEGSNSSETTHAVNQTWLSNVMAAIELAIGEKEIPYPTPDDAFQLYKGIYSQIMGQLKQVEPEAKHRSSTIDVREEPPFDVLVYYPAYDSLEHCVKNTSDDVLYGNVKNVNYVVSLRRYQKANLTHESKAKVEEYFKQPEKTDHCERIDEINGEMENKLLGADGLRAIVSIKCARKFVWYELAYQYFQAAYTEAPKVEVESASKYSSNCGMLVLFP